MISFEEKFQFISKRRSNIVQEKSELEYVHGLMESLNPESYLEVGTAEGDSLYVLGSLISETGRIHWVDKDESTPRIMRMHVEEMLKPRTITGYSGLSTDDEAQLDEQFDVVMIDGGHDYETVLCDCRRFVPLARKLVLWHDIQLAGVKKAVDEYMAGRKYETFIHSETMGYAILRVSND